MKSIGVAAVENGKYADGVSHQVAPVIQLLPVQWQEDRAVVPAKIFDEADDLNQTEIAYVLGRREGKWTVLGTGPYSW